MTLWMLSLIAFTSNETDFVSTFTLLEESNSFSQFEVTFLLCLCRTRELSVTVKEEVNVLCS